MSSAKNQLKKSFMHQFQPKEQSSGLINKTQFRITPEKPAQPLAFSLNVAGQPGIRVSGPMLDQICNLTTFVEKSKAR